MGDFYICLIQRIDNFNKSCLFFIEILLINLDFFINFVYYMKKR